MLFRAFCARSFQTINSKPKIVQVKFFTQSCNPLSQELLLRGKITVARLPTKFKQQVCLFRTSPRLNIPPIFYIIIRPLINVGTVIFGSFFRRWWMRQTPETRQKLLKHISDRKSKIYGIIGVSVLFLAIFYLAHMETAPLTNRRRFIILNKQQQDILAKGILEAHFETTKDNILHKSHPLYKRLKKITDRILKANEDLDEVKRRTWTLSIIDTPVRECYVLLGGNIFISMGMMHMVENDDQLAVILSHEIAHVLLLHAVEAISHNFVWDIVMAIPLTFLWILLPGAGASFIWWLFHGFTDITHHLPYQRAMESEADVAGLMLIAKACYDIREAVVLWGLMRVIIELKEEISIASWLSTHPDPAEREQNLNKLMDSYIKKRSNFGCTVLSPFDPRTKFYKKSKQDHEDYLKYHTVD